MKRAGGDPKTTAGSKSPDAPLGPPFPWPCPSDVRFCGHLRKQKSQSLRFFVLRADPPRLECYENEKKFLKGVVGGRSPPQPRRTLSLQGACTISKRADARQNHLIVLYTSDSSLGVAAANEVEQQAWYSALVEVRAAAATAAAVAANAAGSSSQEDPESWILAPFQDVWPVTLQPKGLGRTRGLGSGDYRLCLGSGTLSLLQKPGSRNSRGSGTSLPPALRLSLLSVRRCGHADSFFFLELGRSAPTGPGELWLRAPDAVVAQSIHETVLAAMKRLRGNADTGKPEPLPRNPQKRALKPPVSTPYETLASPTKPREIPEQDRLKSLERLGAHPKGFDQDGDYITMGSKDDYMYMGGAAKGDYMLMGSPGLPPVPASGTLGQLQDGAGTEYVSMKRFSATSFSYTTKHREPDPRVPGAQHSMGDSWRLVKEPCSWQLSDANGDYVEIPEHVGTGTARTKPQDSCLNYVDLDLVPALKVPSDSPRASPHSYASLEF